ncbi:MAG: MerR family transcriptional regulator [Pseudomonadota bacterium]
MEKSPEAFRTISEVAEWLEVPTHVLRFWESRFAQVKPVKRAGGRRYYRPSDMRLIGGIKKLLHEDGMTIRGVQKLLREEGVKYVSAYSRPLDSDATEPDAEVVSFRHAATDAPAAAPETSPETEEVAETSPEPAPAQHEPEPEIAASPAIAPVEEAEPQGVMQFDSSRGSEETIDLPFIGSARDHPQPVSLDPPSPPDPTIPPTPDVPPTDPADDAPGYATAPGMSARLIAARDRGLIDVGVLSEAARALRALRDRA